MSSLIIVKKNGCHEPYDFCKIKKAVTKSAKRVNVKFSDTQWDKLSDLIEHELAGATLMSVEDIHFVVEKMLEKVDSSVAKAYKDYRNYKKEFVKMMDSVLSSADELNYKIDRSNANTTAALVSTKRSLIYCALSKEIYKKTFLSSSELQAIHDGYIYIHDLSARGDTYNCCLFDMGSVLQGGFEWEHIGYNEPKDVRTAGNLISDITLNCAAQQYGGFTVSEIDSVLAPYARKTYNRYVKEYSEIYKEIYLDHDDKREEFEKKVHEYSMKRLVRDIEQVFQGFEHTFNTVASSRGDYPFVTMTGGCEEDEFGQLVWKTALRVRKAGQGKPGHKRPAIFPKLVFLYTKKLHSKDAAMHQLYLEGVKCSSVAMYPDWLSLDMPDETLVINGKAMHYEPSIAKIFHKYHKFGVSRWYLDDNDMVQENPEWVDSIISPMGCRAYLSPYYENGELLPQDENDKPVFQKRFNGGAVSLNLPMIYMKAQEEGRDFFEVLKEYLDMIHEIHCKTFDFLSKLKASCNPVAFCEGGLGNLSPTDNLYPLIRRITFSYGFTALNELQELATGKSLYECRNDVDCLAFKTEQFIANYVEERKNDRINGKCPYIAAIYATPAESLCLAGDTLVQTYDGYKEIKDIKVNDLVYSFNEITNKIELKPVTFAGKTGENRVVVKVKFTNGQEIICTPNHPFAVRKVNQDAYGVFNGGEHLEYIEAEKLKPGNRVKSNYIKLHGDYLETSSDQYLHHINYEYFNGAIPDGHIIHHRNENKLDNSIDNLQLLSRREHKILHLKGTIGPYTFTTENISGKNNPFYGHRHSEETKEKNRLAHLGKIPHNKIIIDENSLVEKYFDGKSINELANIFNISKQVARNRLIKLGVYQPNHIVESVEVINKLIDVYDITVQDNHNFYVGGEDGILVHNCGTQVEQFRAVYGEIEHVSDRAYFTNSFHMWVGEDITPWEKQDAEFNYFHVSSGGHIQYCRFPSGDNLQYISDTIERAMKLGYYFGVNIEKSYCEHCGTTVEDDVTVCPNCGSTDITTINRVCGYLGYSRVDGTTKMNDAKLSEIADRKSM